jgi:hypothetical protein
MLPWQQERPREFHKDGVVLLRINFIDSNSSPKSAELCALSCHIGPENS